MRLRVCFEPVHTTVFERKIPSPSPSDDGALRRRFWHKTEKPGPPAHRLPMPIRERWFARTRIADPDPTAFSAPHRRRLTVRVDCKDWSRATTGFTRDAGSLSCVNKSETKS
jgi:hypothetical protein